MARVYVFVDGFNLYHALDRNKEYHKYKWLDLRALANCYVTSSENVSQVFYFTALANWDPNKVSRHQAYIKALKTKNITTVLGKFKIVSRKCRAVCNLLGRDKVYETHEEKETDVNIAIYLLEQAFLKHYDKAIIISGDSDLIPAIRAVRRLDASKEIRVVVPIGMNSIAIKKEANIAMRMKEEHLKTSLLPAFVSLPNGGSVSSPKEWLP